MGGRQWKGRGPKARDLAVEGSNNNPCVRFFSTAGPHRHERGITVGECCSQREGDLEVRYPTTRGMGEAAADLGPWEGRKNIRRGNIKVQREKEGGGKTLLQCTGCGWSVYKTKKARGAQC